MRKEEQPISEKETWSVDNENFRYDSLRELIDNNEGQFNPGDTVYVGVPKPPLLSELFDADDVISLLIDRGYDIAGEFADDFMSDVTEQAKQELTELMHTWMEKHVTVDFFTVESVREYILTQEDLLD
jgi:hypothetical protein